MRFISNSCSRAKARTLSELKLMYRLFKEITGNQRPSQKRQRFMATAKSMAPGMLLQMDGKMAMASVSITMNFDILSSASLYPLLRR